MSSHDFPPPGLPDVDAFLLLIVRVLSYFVDAYNGGVCHCIYILLVLLCYRLHAQLHIRFEHSIAEIRLDRLIGVLHVLLSQLL